MYDATAPLPSPASSFAKFQKMPEDTVPAGCAVSSGARWVVTEKVHGANFSLLLRGPHHETVFCKRSGEIPAGENFYAFRSQGLPEKLAGPGDRLFADLQGRLGEGGLAVVAVQVYGELFGGHYPHPDVSPVPGLLPVQRGIWYSEHLEFIAFDVAVIATRGGGGGGQVEERFNLAWGDARACCEAAGMPFTQPLAIGPLSDMLDFPIVFESTIHQLLGLPPLGALGQTNVAEGVVVRPADGGGGGGGGGGGRAGGAVVVGGVTLIPDVNKDRAGRVVSRGLFKRKIEAFNERQM